MAQSTFVFGVTSNFVALAAWAELMLIDVFETPLRFRFDIVGVDVATGTVSHTLGWRRDRRAVSQLNTGV